MPTMTATRRCKPAVRLLAGAGLLLTTAWAGAAVTDAFTARFTVHRGVFALGTTMFRLKQSATPGCYIYSGKADPNAIAHLFVGKLTEQSRFCIARDASLYPQHFFHHVAGDKKKSYTLDFDWAKHRVTYQSEAGKHKTMVLGEHAYDPLSLQIAARRWLARSDTPARLGTADFLLVNKDKIEDYWLRVSPGGPVKTPGGRFDTLLVERVRTHHKVLFWLARHADWLPVRIENQKNGDTRFKMDLQQLRRPRP